MALRERGAHKPEDNEPGNENTGDEPVVNSFETSDISEDGLAKVFGTYGENGKQIAETLNNLINLYGQVVKNPGNKEVEGEFMRAMGKVLALPMIGKAGQALTILSAGIAALAVLREDGDL